MTAEEEDKSSPAQAQMIGDFSADISESSSPIKQGMSPNTTNMGNCLDGDLRFTNNFTNQQTKGGKLGFSMGMGTAEQDLILKPLPLLDISVPIQQEPGLLKAFKRSLLQAKLRRMNEVEGCPHTKVENWICLECNNKVSSFGCIFDSNKGKVHTYMKVVYENDFLEDFNNANAIGNGIPTEDNGGEGGPQSNSEQIRQSSDNNNNMAEGDEGNGFNANAPEIIYQQYQPSNVTELREYILFIICKKLKKQFMRTQSILGPGHVNHLSSKLINYLQENDKNRKKLVQKYLNDILLFDSIFECGNLLQAEILNPTEYQLYMQVDTNTRGHQQWFFFRVKNTKADRKYTFRIMNFTKQGLTTNSTTNNQAQPQQPSGLNQNTTIASGTAGIQVNQQQNQNTINVINQQKRSPAADHLQKIHFKSKQAGDSEWRVIDSDQLEFVKTSVQRKRKDILAAAADSDQEEMNEAEAGEIGAGDQGSSQKFLKSKTQKKKKPQYYYALQFNVTFTHNNDSVYFAYSLPYTLTEMTELILNKEQQIQVVETQEEEVKSQNEDGESSKDSEENKQSIPVPNIGSNPSQIQGTQGGTPSWQENGCTFEVPSKCIFYKREIMARSICGLPLYQITISRDSKTYKRKPVVIVTSRVHAAETPASYVFDGIYNFLCSNNPEAKFLRKFYTFILVPTLNPDGVVCGNYRSSISGVDLNRQWIAPDEEFQPEIYSIKQLMKTIGEKERRQLWIYCDLHGHSKKKNTFFYGCNTAANGGFLSWTIVRLLPRIFAKKTHLFNYRDCRFKVEPYKLGTGRVVAWKQFMITHSFTLEASFYGYDFGEDEHRLFTPKDYGDVGQKFCQSIYELHFLWKSIRNELKLTNGWLKPRKLIEITGVPAAQILSEELQKKKKEDQKRKAIEHYEQFLKKFYNKSDGHGPSSSSQNNANGTNNRRASKLLSAQNNNPQALFMPQSSQKPRVVTVQPGLGVQSKQATAEKSRNRDLNSGNTQERSNHNAALSGARGNLIPVSSSQDEFSLQNEEERIYNLLQGLVKIQALIRGFLVRKKFKIKIPQIRIGLAKNKVFVKTQKPRDIEEDFDVQLQNSGNPLRSSDLQSLGKASLHDKLMLGGIAYGEAGDKSSQIKQKEDWRLYFQDNELDTAYNHVEVEREDDPEDALSAGSSSNPSNDNFDLQEMYEQIYQLPNAKEQAKRKKEAKRRFMQEINDQDYIDQQSMFQILDGAFKGKRGQLVHKSINQLKSKVKRGKPDLKTNQATSAQVSPEKMIIRRPSLDQRDLNLIKKSDNASPMQQHNNFEDNEAYPLTAHQIIDPNKSSHQRLHTGNQQRHLYQYGPNHFQNHQNITNAQLKMFNQNVIIGPSNAGYGGNAGFGPHYGKKESIQQVIKDCFITKKIGNPSSTQNNFFGAQHSEGSRVHSVNQKSQQVNHYQQTTSGNGGSGQKRNHNNNNGSSNHQSKSASKATNHGQQFKTPAQRLQEQRDQIKQYFNHNQPGQQLSVGSGYEKYRALMRENAIPMQQQFVSYGENNMNYPSPLTMISSKIEGNAVPLTQGLIINQALSNTNSNTHEHPTSSLFMKYVKSKLVRKIRTDQIPQQITDKYIDLYKELIDKEAQKKAEEQDFLRKHIQNSTSTNPNSFTATSQIATQQSQLTRNKIQTRSEQKSRSKHLARGAGGAGTYQNHTSRKQQQQPVNLQSSFVTYGMMQNQPQQQHSIMNAKYDEPIGANINSLNMTFNEQKQQLNEVIMVRQSSELHRQLQSGINNNNYNRNQDTNNEYDVKASSNSDIIDPSMKLPLIGNFAHTVDYKKKSRETLIDNPTSNSGVFARQQAAAFAINQNSNEEQITMKTPLTNSNIQQQTQQTVMLPLGGNYPLEASNQNISMYSINNAAQKDLIVPVDIKSPQPKVILQAQGTGRRHIMAPATSGNGGGYSNMNKRGGAGVVSDNSIDSSIDEEMLDKIKNIYSEMRKHTGGPAPGNNSSLYYGGTSNHSGYPQSNLYYPGIVNNSFSRSMMNGPSKGGSYQAPSNNRGHKARIHGNQSSQIVSHHTVDDNGTSGINQSQSNYFNMHHNAGSGVQGPQRQHGNFINAGMPMNQGK